MFSSARRVLRSHPWLSVTASSVASITSYAYYVEHQTKSQAQLLVLPKDYNRDALMTYWNNRPISVIHRIFTIFHQVLPFALSYTRDFYILPYLSLISSSHQQNKEEMQTMYAKELRNILTSLGPAFVKLGQQLSIRPDLLPANVLFELQLLCDQVTPISDDVAKSVLVKEFQGKIQILNENENSNEKENGNDTMSRLINHNDENVIWIKDFKLVASASLGQVYKATRLIRNNNSSTEAHQEEIAIKIQRPEMKEKVSLDLYLLNNYGQLLDYIFDKITNQIPFHESFINCFAHGSYNELDYIKEAGNQNYLKKELAKRGITSDVVYIPNVYNDMTSEKVITMDWVDGIKLANAQIEDVEKLIPVGVELFLTQLLDIGFFHSDPHPGNLYVIHKKAKSSYYYDGSSSNPNAAPKPILCLLDFGLCAQIDSKSRLAMTTAIVHLLNGDYDTLINKDAKQLGFLPHDLDISNTDIHPILTKILKEGLLESKSNLVERKRNLMSISNELNRVFFEYPFSVPPFFALITRGLGLLEGIALSGDPNFDIFQASYPYASKRAAEIYGKHSWSWLKNTLRDFELFIKGGNRSRKNKTNDENDVLMLQSIEK